MTTATGPERVENMMDVLRQWQCIERQSMVSASVIIETSKNPLIRLLMEILQHDSVMHHRVQQFLIDSLTEKPASISREEVAEVWAKLEEHERMEKRTLEMAEALRDQAWSPVHKHLLTYLLTDESKHETLLASLDELKAGMAKASG